MKAYHFDGKAEEDYKEIEIPSELKATAEIKRNELIEAVAEYDRITSYNVCYTKLLRYL